MVLYVLAIGSGLYHGPLDSLAHGRKTEPARCDSVYELRPVTAASYQSAAAASATATASILPYSTHPYTDCS